MTTEHPAGTPAALADAETADPRLWIIAVGSDVYVLHNAFTAEAQYTVCVGANLDPHMFRLTPQNWARVRAELAAGDEVITIIDTQVDQPETVGGGSPRRDG